MVGAAAARLKNRLDMIYDVRSDEDGRSFSGLHDTLLPMSSKTRSIFQQLRASKSRATGKAKKTRRTSESESAKNVAQNAGKISGQVLGSITGVDLRHLLLLLPFLLFDLLDEEINSYTQTNGCNLFNPVHELIKLVLLLLEWYHFYR